MLVEFDDIIEVVLHHEGGYVNDPDDPGGETNFGVAKRSHPDVDIANLTKDDCATLVEAFHVSLLETVKLSKNKTLDKKIS